MRGDDQENMLYAAWGDDVVEGRGGADELHGGPGNDTAEYVSSDAGVTVSLQAAAAGDAFSVVGQGGDAEGDRLAMATDSQGNLTDRNSFENLTGSMYDDVLIGDDNANVLRGLAGDDELFGNAGDDRLIGGTGADHHDGGGGRDWVDYSEAASSVEVDLDTGGSGGDAENDTFVSIENIQGSTYADDLQGNSASNDINPGGKIGAGIDQVDGGAEADDGGDRLILNYASSNSSLQGGYDYEVGSEDAGEFANQVEFNEIERLQVVGSQFSDTIRGGGGDDSIAAGMGNDTIFSGQGTNNINADDGNDTVVHYNDAFGNIFYNPPTDSDVMYWIAGGGGIDTFSGNLAHDDYDVVLTSLNPDVESNDQFFLPGNGSALYGFERFQAIQTGGGADQLTQLGRIDNDFRTGAGNDIVNTGLGLDYADGGIDGFSSGEHPIYGDDLLVVDYSVGDTGQGMQSDVSGSPLITSHYYRNAEDELPWDAIEFINFERAHVRGTQHDDNIVGLVGADELRGRAGADTIMGQSGNDRIFGGRDNDVIYGGSGDDEMRGGRGNDIIIDDTNEDDAEGGADQLFGGNGDDWMLAGNGNDMLEGGSGNDLLIGGNGNDDLDGGSGNDILIGINFGAIPFPAAAEIDTMTGGTGADQFWLGDGLFPYYADNNLITQGSQHQAIITDFSLQEGDAIVLHGDAGDYILSELDGSTRILRSGGVPELIGTLEGVTGLDLNSDAFQYFDDEAEGPGMELPVKMVQTISATTSESTIAIADLQGLPNTQEVSLLLPAVQSAQAAATRETVSGNASQQFTSEVVAASEPVEAIALNPAMAATLDPAPAQAELADSNAFRVTQQSSAYTLLNTVLGDTTGLTILDAQTEGDARAFGIFEYDPFGLGNGIVLGTGKVTDLVGPNTEDGGFVGNASIPLNFTKLGSGAGFLLTPDTQQASFQPGNGGNDWVLNPGNLPADAIDDVVANPGSSPETAIFRANLSSLQQLQSLTIADSGSGTGGARGERTGFDLVGVKISNVLINDATSIDDIPGLDVFDFSPLSTYFTPGDQRPSSNAEYPETADMFGAIHGNVNNAIATLDEFDFDGDTGFLSLGDGGSIGFNLKETLDMGNLNETFGIDPDSPLYLYVGEAGNNGESLTGQITASAQRINGQTELSTDFGLAGAGDDIARFAVSFEADDSVEQMFFRFVFGSEEFVEYGGSDFNDAFSIKLNGFNLARLSDGAEVSINNLVPNPFGGYHPDFIHNPVDGGPASSETPLDGYTQVLTFAGAVTPNAVNHLEIEVKDVGDDWKDSFVLMQSGSLGVSETPLGSFDFFANESTLLEGNSSILNLNLNTLPTETVTVTLDPDEQIDLGNGAGNPLDVVFTPEDALTNREIMFTAFDDTLVEGGHSGFITATVQSNDVSYSSLDDRIVEQLIVDNDDPIGLDPILLGGHTGIVVEDTLEQTLWEADSTLATGFDLGVSEPFAIADPFVMAEALSQDFSGVSALYDSPSRVSL
ncbi:MAG: choice-of-anchor L domain-containing protein [Cyanobacteria bacterium P01_F01_bin.86]